MKKLAAILLLCIFLFHWMGYQVLYGYWMRQADEKLEAQLDKAVYNEQELETIAIPLHLPYLTNQSAFERVDGEINLNGITYKYVQRRVWHDSLYLQCIPNHESMRLATARSNSFQLANEIPEKGAGFSKVEVGMSKQFTDSYSEFELNSKVDFVACQAAFTYYKLALPTSPFTTSPEQPPECLS